MKRMLFAALLTSASLSAGAQVAHWTFNGNTNDVGPNAINGTATNCTYVSGATGAPATAIKFNGANSRVDAPYHPACNTATFSIKAIVRVDGFNSDLCEGAAIFTQESSSGNFRKNLLITDNMYNNCGDFSPADMRFQPAAHGSSGQQASAGQYPGGINLGQWYCVVTTYDGKELKLYIDGILKLTQPWSNQFASSNPPISIGYFAPGFNVTGYPYWFNGAIDDIEIFNFAVQAAEIPTLCKDFKPEPCSIKDISYCSKLSSPFEYTFTPTVGPAGSNVSWDFGDGTIVNASGSQAVTHAFPATGGSYKICLTVLDAQGKPCANKCFTMCQDPTSGARSANPNGSTSPVNGNEPRLEPYPNPAGDLLNVPVKGSATAPVKVTIFTLEGKALRTESSSRSDAGLIQLSTANLVPGSYLVEINDANGRTVKPFTKR